MNSNVGTIETGVDDLLKLLKKEEKISIAEAAKKLAVDANVLQTWVDFLVEESIIGIEYKFITPYIYLVKKTATSEEIAQKDPLEIKKDFYEQALARHIPVARVNLLWKQYLTNNIVEIKEQFVAKAKSKGLEDRMIEKLWNKYKMYLLTTSDET